MAQAFSHLNEAGADIDGMRVRRFQGMQSLGKRSNGRLRVFADVGAGGAWLDQFAIHDHGPNQRLTFEIGIAFGVKGYYVAIGVAIDLFGAGERALFTAEFCRVVNGVAALQLNKFVDCRKCGCIGGGGELGADAKGVDGRSGAHQFGEPVFVQIVGDEDFRITQAGVVENAADFTRELNEVALSRRTPQQGGPSRATKCAASTVL